MYSLLIALTLLVSLANLLDFLIGDKGNRAIKQRLPDIYIFLEEGDWTQIYRYPSHLLREYLQSKLYVRGRNQISLLRVLLYTSFAFFLLHVTAALINSSISSCNIMAARNTYIAAFMKPFYIYLAEIPVYFLVNFLMDVALWSLLIIMLKRFENSSPTLVAGHMILYIIFAFTVFNVVFFLQYLIHVVWNLVGAVPLSSLIDIITIAAPNGWKIIYSSLVESGFKSMSFSSLSFACSQSADGTVIDLEFTIDPSGMILVGPIVAVAPLLMLIATSFLLVVAYSSRNFWRRPAAFLVERIDSYPKGVFTLGAAALAAIIALLQKI